MKSEPFGSSYRTAPLLTAGPRSAVGRAHTFVSPSADSRRAVVSYWRKYVHEVLAKPAHEICG